MKTPQPQPLTLIERIERATQADREFRNVHELLNGQFRAAIDELTKPTITAEEALTVALKIQAIEKVRTGLVGRIKDGEIAVQQQEQEDAAHGN